MEYVPKTTETNTDDHYKVLHKAGFGDDYFTIECGISATVAVPDSDTSFERLE